jgi:hypothetical protein
VSMIVGIFPDGSKLAGLINSLVSAGKEPSRLTVLWCDEVPTELASMGPEFVWLGDVVRSSSGGMITDSGGIRVPGLNSGGSTGSSSLVENDELLDSLSDLAIPDGRTDDYARAIEQGRLVVGYPGDADSAGTRQLFASAGATTVEEF